MEDKELKVVYEDNHIIVVIKPQNIPSQQDSSNDLDMLTKVKQYIKEKYNKPGNVYVGLVHRLDRPTGGLMVFAKTSKMASRLAESIKNGEFTKKYLAVLVGKPKYDEARLINYLKKDEKENVVKVVPQLEEGAKYAELSYKILDSNNKLSLAEIKLQTGRSHQIRVQTSTIGNPVFGDVKYGGDIAKGYNLALWAYKLSFEHPISKQMMNFICYPPTDEIPWKFFKIDVLINKI